MSLPLCFHLYLSLIAATATMLMAVAATQAGGQVLQMELWCVAKDEDYSLQTAIDWACGKGGADCGPIQQGGSSLQTAIDWACGKGGADCGPIQPGGPCYDPNDIVMMASYVFNDYYQKHRVDEACNFNNNAVLTVINPSRGTCKFPSSKSVRNGQVGDDTSMAAGQAYKSDGFNGNL